MTDKKTEYQRYLEEVHSRSTIPEAELDKIVIDMVGSPITEKERIVKGEANEVYDVKTKDGNKVFVRIERKGPGFVQEQWAIDQCRKIGVPVPEIIGITKLTVGDENLAICVQKKIEGDTLERGGINLDDLDKETLRKIINQAGAILAKIHSIPTQGFDRLDGQGVGEFKTFAEMMLDQVTKKEAYLELAKKIDLDTQVIIDTMKALSDHQHLYQNVKPVLNHGDYAPKHFMVVGDKITGILDWGEVQGNSPLYDFANWDYWFGDWVPTKWLKEGYTDKSIFDENSDTITQLIKIRKGLTLIYWYDQFNYPQGVNKAKQRLITDIEFFK